MTTKTPVVVTGGSANALGVLRSLSHCDLTLCATAPKRLPGTAGMAGK